MFCFPRSLVRFLLLLTLAGEWALAAPHWILVTTPHFEMYTTNSEKQAIKVLQTFEQVRYFFLQSSKNRQGPEGRVRIIAFSSEKEYKPYRISSGAFAYYLQSHERDYIVMQDIETDHHQTAVHEYTHLIVQHSHMQLPIWLNEGLADLYSSLEPNGSQQAMVGRPLPYRLISLSQQTWMPWNNLFAVGYDSPYYNEKEKMSIFYAQSWALTHMLALSSAYMPRFSPFLSAVANGLSTPEALQKIYGKNVAEVGKDVAAYVRQTTVQAFTYNVALSSSDLHAEKTEPSELQTGLTLADLLATRKESQAEAKNRLTALLQQNPQSIEVEESLGYLAWQEEHVPEARKHFSQAVEKGSHNSKMIYDLARLEQSSGVSSQTVVDLLQKLLILQPDHNEARILLAQVDAGRGRYAQALAALAPIHKVSSEQAYRFFSVTAYSRANLQDFAEARKTATQALQYAKTQDERLPVERLLSSLNSVSSATAATSTTSPNVPSTKPLEDAGSTLSEPVPVPTTLKRSQGLPRVLGKTKEFECRQGSFRLHLQVGTREMVFGISDLQDVVVRNRKDLQWSCGALPPQEVTVVYQAADTAKLDGMISELIF